LSFNVCQQEKCAALRPTVWVRGVVQNGPGSKVFQRRVVPFETAGDLAAAVVAFERVKAPACAQEILELKVATFDIPTSGLAWRS
jgi:hypothetical protein